MISSTFLTISQHFYGWRPGFADLDLLTFPIDFDRGKCQKPLWPILHPEHIGKFSSHLALCTLAVISTALS